MVISCANVVLCSFAIFSKHIALTDNMIYSKRQYNIYWKIIWWAHNHSRPSRFENKMIKSISRLLTNSCRNNSGCRKIGITCTVDYHYLNRDWSSSPPHVEKDILMKIEHKSTSLKLPIEAGLFKMFKDLSILFILISLNLAHFSLFIFYETKNVICRSFIQVFILLTTTFINVRFMFRLRTCNVSTVDSLSGTCMNFGTFVDFRMRLPL